MMHPQYDFQVFVEQAKPCPLCGSRNIVTNSREYEEDKHRIGAKYFCCIECDDCGLQYMGSGEDEYGVALLAALEHWNRRAKV